ncbi:MULTISPECIES: YciE/YciF ferroxidase family protein [Arthrobacter]|uniref:YciE/YciF ferroxidase family protein n=1 Tax=unclassified Arthrobacter TaxID=235627 RepID=UPI0024B9841E|nr:DUF892 family protein [Arthrobacter sp. H35-MC1]MDJ0316098.1 DUF892 family protein [Arthrobacter sp. H35-MC1]
MFEHFTTVEEIFNYKLGSALTMEYDSLEMLGELEKTVMRSDLKGLFHEHAHETRQQIENLLRCFALLGVEAKQSPSPTTKGLAKETKLFTAKTDNSLVDAVALAGALESEHYETAVYETLITHAKASGVSEIVHLLSSNLAQEESAIMRIRAAADAVVRADATNAADQGDAGAVQDASVQVPPFLPPSSI